MKNSYVDYKISYFIKFIIPNKRHSHSLIKSIVFWGTYKDFFKEELKGCPNRWSILEWEDFLIFDNSDNDYRNLFYSVIWIFFFNI